MSCECPWWSWHSLLWRYGLYWGGGHYYSTVRSCKSQAQEDWQAMGHLGSQWENGSWLPWSGVRKYVNTISTWAPYDSVPILLVVMCILIYCNLDCVRIYQCLYIFTMNLSGDRYDLDNFLWATCTTWIWIKNHHCPEICSLSPSKIPWDSHCPMCGYHRNHSLPGSLAIVTHFQTLSFVNIHLYLHSLPKQIFMQSFIQQHHLWSIIHNHLSLSLSVFSRSQMDLDIHFSWGFPQLSMQFQMPLWCTEVWKRVRVTI